MNPLKCLFYIINVPGFNGDNEIRTRDLLLARQALSQLSYIPGYREQALKIEQ